MFIIQEIQTTGINSTLTPAVTHADRNNAESAFHMICASAALSQVEVHTVLMYDEHGNTIRREYYEHPKEAEDE